MKSRIIKPLIMLSAVVTLSTVNAQVTASAKRPNVDDSTSSTAPVQRDEIKAEAKAAIKSDKPEKPERPRIDRAEAKESVEEIKSSFRAKAEEYVKKQRELVAELKSAKGEEKTKVREKLKDLKDNWKDDQPSVRDIVSDLKDKIDKEKDKKGGKGKPRD